LHRFLGLKAQELLKEERRILLELRGPLVQLDAAPADFALLDRIILQLDELFLLVIVGEFNAGKSAFINALLGTRFLEEGVTPTTTHVQIIKWGERAGQENIQGDTVTLTYPADWLRDISLVDTPGTNAVIQRHQQITEEFVPRSDLVLFVTSADRPFSESERLFLSRIREWGKKVIVIVNKIDILESSADVDRVMSYVAANAQALLGQLPISFPISARLARQSKESSDSTAASRLLEMSRMAPLESYILTTLDERQRLRLKLLSPIGVAQRLVATYLGAATARKALLQSDVGTISDIEAQLAEQETDMRRDFGYRLRSVENVLYAFEQRGNRFFDDTIRLARIRDLVSSDRVRVQFEREVVSDTAAQIDAQTQELIDWLVSEDLTQWQRVTERLSRRMALNSGEAGHPSGMAPMPWFRPGFEHNRQELLRSVGQAAREVVDTYDQRSEAKALAESLQVAVAQTALFEVGALGLGALLVKLLAVTIADVTGLLAAGAVAVLGLFIIPFNRRRAKRNLAARVSELRQRLTRALTNQFEMELSHSMARVRDAVRPYARFVEQQLASTSGAESAVQNAKASMHALSERIEGHLG